MIARLNSSPTLTSVPTASRLRRSLESGPAPGTDLVQLSDGASAQPAAAPAPVPAAALARTGSSLASKILAGVGLAGVALSLAGCRGGTTTTEPTKPATPPEQTQSQPAAASLSERLAQLKKGDKTVYLNMAEASYYHRVLDTIAKEADPGAEAIVNLAKKGNEAWNFNGDPAAQRTNQRDVLNAIAQGPRADGIAGRYQDVAKAVLKVGESISGKPGQAAGDGYVTTLKVNGYEMALTQLLQRLPDAHAQLQSTTGYDPAIVKNYTEGLATTARIGLEAGKELNDPGLQSVVLETTVTELYGRIKEDSGVLGTQVQTALDLAMQLKQRFGG